MHSIYKQGNLPYLSVKVCPNCEQILALDVECCPQCSYNFTFKSMNKPALKLKKEDVQTNQQTPAYTSSQQVPSSKLEQVSTPIAVIEKRVEVKKERVVFCDNCGAKIIGSQRYCGGCGAKVSKRICPSCDQIVDSNLIFCPLCGERLQESVTNVEPVATPVTNQPVQQTVQPVTPSVQPINIFVNPNTGTTKVEEQPVVETPIEEVPQEEQEVLPIEETPVSEELTSEEKVETETTEPVAPVGFEGVNMGRKRLFLIIQILLVGVIAAIMVMIPILTKDNFFTALVPCIKGTSTETLISGKDLVDYVQEIIANKKPILDSSSVIYPMISGEGGASIFTNMSFVGAFLKLIKQDPAAINASISIIVVLSCYVLIALAMVISIISGFVGMFTKNAYKGKSLGFLLITLLLSCLLIYTSTFFKPFKTYDSWLIYAFAICFFVWFIIKLVFGKEARLYKKDKEQKAIAKEIEKEIQEVNE